METIYFRNTSIIDICTIPFGLLLKIVFSLHITVQLFDNNDSLEIAKNFY